MSQREGEQGREEGAYNREVIETCNRHRHRHIDDAREAVGDHHQHADGKDTDVEGEKDRRG